MKCASSNQSGPRDPSPARRAPPRRAVRRILQKGLPMPRASRASRLGALAACGALGLTGALVLPALAASGESDGEAPYFTRVATMPAHANSDVSEEAVAEISSVSPDGTTVYSTDAGGGRVGITDISDPSAPEPLGGVEVEGEPTSVYALEDHVLVVVDTTDGDLADPSGHVSVLDADTHEVVRTIELGGQPDSIDITSTGSDAYIAIENQRDEELAPEGLEEGDLPQQPTGWLAHLDLTGDVEGWDVERIELAGLPGLAAAEDAEPEYVKVSPDDTRVVVTLQENNALAVVDVATNEVITSFSAGEATVEDVDTEEDGDITLDGTITEEREPDAIAWVDDTHVATADEGDWKGGSRTWSIFDTTTGEVTWSSGSQMDHLAVGIGQYPEARSEKKGTEPEGIAVARYGDRTLAFVGSERGNFVAVHDVTDPSAPVYQQALSSTPGPEGLLPIPERDLLVVSSEEDDAEAGVRATVQVYQLGAGADEDRTIVSGSDADGKPLPWGALSDLSAVPGTEEEFVSVSDSGYRTSALFRIDASATPAVIRERIELTGEDGSPLESDLEGVTALADGTFWVASEGAREDDGTWGIPNSLMHVDAAGQVLETVPLPEDVADGLESRGFEGVTIAEDGTALYAVIQGVADGDPESTARIARYDLEAGAWSYWGYELESPSVDGDKVGLSAIADLGDGRFALVERDSLNGPDAALKSVVTVTLPGEGAATGEELPLAESQSEAYDLLPLLESTNGWTQEKVESLAVTEQGEVVIVTDNDALEDASGETLFARAGFVGPDGIQAEPPAPEGDDPTEQPNEDPTEEPTEQPTGDPTEEPSGESTAPSGEEDGTEAPTDPAAGSDAGGSGPDDAAAGGDRPAEDSGTPADGASTADSTSTTDEGEPSADTSRPGALARTGAQGVAALVAGAAGLSLLGGGALALRARLRR